jgi:hypothetical protein
LNFGIAVAVDHDEVIHIVPLKSAVPPRSQAIDRKKSSVGPLPHYVVMDIEELAYLGGG